MKVRKRYKVKIEISMIVIVFMLNITGCGSEKPVLMQKSEAALTEETAKEERSTGMDTEEPTDIKAEQTAGENGFCYVHICGAVMEPGVYEVPAGSRVYEVIKLAGGFMEEASTDHRNQAEIVTDGEQIMILTVQEALDVRTQEIQSEEKTAQAGSTLVNINTAQESVLCTLPGIGSGKAASIIAYREEHGNFQTIEGILKVDGIKNGVYAKLKDKITVS